jgi:hypothetical protein
MGWACNENHAVFFQYEIYAQTPSYLSHVPEVCFILAGTDFEVLYGYQEVLLRLRHQPSRRQTKFRQHGGLRHGNPEK